MKKIVTIQIWQIKNLLNESSLLKLQDGHFLEISQYTENSITLDMQPVQLLSGQLVSIIGDLLINQEKHHFEAVAKVAAMTSIEDGLMRIEFDLKQIQKTIWQDFLQSKRAAQDHVDQLLKKIKGEI